MKVPVIRILISKINYELLVKVKLLGYSQLSFLGSSILIIAVCFVLFFFSSFLDLNCTFY